MAIQDALAIRSFPSQSTLSMSPDGRWVAFTLIQSDRRRSAGAKWAIYTPSGVPNQVDGAQVWIANTATREQRRISDPQFTGWAPAFSPDGTRIAFYSDAKGKARLWVYDLAKRDARAVCEAQVRVGSSYENPVWSADGGALYAKFLPADIGALNDSPSSTNAEPPVRVFRAPAERASGPAGLAAVVAPDGGSFVGDLSAVTVATGAIRRLLPSLSIRGWWLSPEGRRLAYTAQTSIEHDNADDRLFTLGVIDLRTSRSQLIGTNLALVSHGAVISWSPKGDRLAYVTGHASELGETRPAQVWVVGKAGEAVPVAVARGAFPKRPHVFRAPVWDRSGRYLLLLDPRHLYVYDLKARTGKAIPPAAGKQYTEILSSQGSHQAWTDQIGKALVVVRDESTKQLEFLRMDLSTGSVELLAAENQSLNAHPMLQMTSSADGKLFAYTAQSADSPPNVWIAAAGFSRARRLTQTNPELLRYVFGESRVITWNSSDGKVLRGALLLPAGYETGKRYPLIVNVYGGNDLSNHVYEFGLSNAAGPTNAQLFATRGYAVLEPDTPMGRTHPALDVLEDVMSGVDRAVEIGVADPNRLAIMGASYGGYGTLAILTQTARFRAAVSISGVSDLMQQYTWMEDDGSSIWIGWAEASQGRMPGTPWQYRDTYVQNSPVWFADRIATPVLIACGTDEQPVTTQCRSMFVSLRRLGKTAEYREYPGGGHLVQRWKPQQQADFLEAMLRWFDQYVRY